MGFVSWMTANNYRLFPINEESNNKNIPVVEVIDADEDQEVVEVRL